MCQKTLFQQKRVIFSVPFLFLHSLIVSFRPFRGIVTAWHGEQWNNVAGRIVVFITLLPLVGSSSLWLPIMIWWIYKLFWQVKMPTMVRGKRYRWNIVYGSPRSQRGHQGRIHYRYLCRLTAQYFFKKTLYRITVIRYYVVNIFWGKKKSSVEDRRFSFPISRLPNSNRRTIW